MKTRGPRLTRIFCLLVILSVTAEINAQADRFTKGKQFASWSARRQADFTIVGPSLREIHGQVYSRSAGDHRSEHAGRWIRDRHQPRLRCG